MAVSADTLRTHRAYTTWASRRLVDAAARLGPEELTRDFQTADQSVLRTLAHVFAADRVWLARLTQAPTPQFITEADYSLAVLHNGWPALGGGWGKGGGG